MDHTEYKRELEREPAKPRILSMVEERDSNKGENPRPETGMNGINEGNTE